MGKRLQLFGTLLVGGILAAAAGGLLVAGHACLRQAPGSFLFLGRPLLELRSPMEGQLVTLGSIEVIVSFPAEDRVAPETFRCLLNDQDVTARLTVGRNGAAGSVHGLTEGENRLRVEVRGRGWWTGRYGEESREVLFRVQPLPYMNRVRAPAGPGCLTAPGEALACPQFEAPV